MESVESAIRRAGAQREVQDLVRRIEHLAAMPMAIPPPPATPADSEQRRQLALALSRWFPALVTEMAAGLGLKPRDPLVIVNADGDLVIRLERK